MTPEQRQAIEERYRKALDAKPSKGPIDPAPLWDAVCDIPDLLKALDVTHMIASSLADRVDELVLGPQHPTQPRENQHG